ncbi:MAG: MarR family transcriptional regulator [Streptosporangiales bacterium]|nr:MarR family transcriptional regulator [Streptosporangiales bacterium]
MWLQRLADAGLRVELADGGRTLVVDGAAFAVRRRARIRPSEIPDLEPHAVLVVPSAGSRTTEALNRTGWSWITTDGRGRLRLPGRTITLDRPDGDAAEPQARDAIRPPAERAVLGHLLGHPGPHRQVAIAEAVGVTQARVSQVLSRAVSNGDARRGAAGWEAVNAARILDVLAGTGFTPTLEQRWYHLDPPRQQIDLAMEAVRSAGARWRLSGDWAADVLAPWRLPGLVVIHADRTVDLEAAGFVPVVSDEATLVTAVHDIRDAWRIAPPVQARLVAERPEWPFAPIEEIAHDMLMTGEADAPEALTHLKARFLAARAEAEAS